MQIATENNSEGTKIILTNNADHDGVFELSVNYTATKFIRVRFLVFVMSKDNIQAKFFCVFVLREHRLKLSIIFSFFFGDRLFDTVKMVMKK